MLKKTTKKTGNLFKIYLLTVLFLPGIMLTRPQLLCAEEQNDCVTNINSFTVNDNCFQFTTISGLKPDTIGLSVSFVNPHVVKITASSGKVKSEQNGLSFDFIEKNDSFYLNTERLSLQIQKSPFDMRIFRVDDKSPLISCLGSQSVDKIPVFKTEFNMDIDEHFYGFGEKFNGLDQRGNKVVMELADAYMVSDGNTYKSIPFFLSSKGYGLLVNSARRIVFHMGDEHNDKYSIEYPGEVFEYYIFTDKDPLKNISQYTEITGKSPLIPQWSLEPWLSRRTVTGWDRVETAECEVDKMIADGFRLGVILWEGIASRIFPKEQSELMYKLSNKWHEMGIKQVFWSRVGHIREKQKRKEKIPDSYFIRKADSTLCEGGFNGCYYYFDPTNPEAMDYWWNTYYNHVVTGQNEKSVPGHWNLDGVKIDFCELFPKDDSNLLTYSKVDGMHNLHAVLFSEQIYNRLNELKPDGGITWVRGGGLGLQKVGFAWGGDRGRTFKQLLGTVRASLGVSICGVSLIGHDLGGYRGDDSEEAKKVYIRGVQYAAFSPSFHDHGSAPGPWEQDEIGQENYKFYSRLRYNLVPYLYHYVCVSHRTGIPMMRSLYLHHPNDENTFSVEDQYYLGDNLLIAPIVTFSDTRKIYLPQGQWIDFWTRKQYEGRQFIEYTAPLNQIPVFVNSSTILPLQLNDTMQVGGIFPQEKKDNLLLTFRLFDGPDSKFEFYGKTNVTVEKTHKNNQLLCNVNQIKENFGIIADDIKPESITINGQPLKSLNQNDFVSAQQGWLYDSHNQQTFIKIQSNPDVTDYKIVLNNTSKKAIKKQPIVLESPEILQARGWDQSVLFSLKSVKNATSYKIEYWQQGTKEQTKTISETNTLIKVPNLINGATYSFSVKAVNDGTTSPANTFAVTPQKRLACFKPEQETVMIHADHFLIKSEPNDSTVKYQYGIECPKETCYSVWIKARKNEPHHRYLRWYHIGNVNMEKGGNRLSLLLKKSTDVEMLFLTENPELRPEYNIKLESSFSEQKQIENLEEKLLYF